jgi:hypothetical protein
MRLSCARAAAAATVLWPTLALAADPAAAREQLKIGYSLSREGKCAEALPHLEESVRLDVKAITLINLANCEEKTGRLGDAMGHWVEARARAEAESAQPILEEAERRAKALEPRLPRLTIVLPEGVKDAVVIRDETTLGSASLGLPLPVNPGAHVIRVNAPGRVEATTKVAIQEGEQKRVEVTLGGPAPATRAAERTPPPGAAPRTRTSPFVWVGFGGAVAFAAAGTITGLIAVNRANAAESDCPNHRCPDQDRLDDIDTGRTFGTISTVAFAAAGAFALLGVYGLLWGPRGSSNVAVSFGPRDGRLGGRF